MKLIKKIVAIMFAFIMVFSLSTNVKAVNGVNASQGSITLDKVRNGETYKIYRILDLDSYNYPTGNPKGGNYSYTYKKQGDKNATEWKNFIDTNTGDGEYFKKTGSTSSNYFTANDGVNGEDIAKAALQYVKKNGIEADDSYTATENGTYTFNYLPLGYYLVESTVSALCSLDTTNPNQTIKVKYGEPTVKKEIVHSTSRDSTYETASIGDIITYNVIITVKKGAKDYVFHDKLDNGLKYSGMNETLPFNVQFTTTKKVPSVNGSMTMLKPGAGDYTLIQDETNNSFSIEFTNDFIQKFDENDEIHLMYCAVVTKDALMNTAINNTAYLKYGNKQETTKVSTNVYTYQIPVFKYTGEGKQALAGATFKLYKDTKDDKNLLTFENKAKDVYAKDVYKYNRNTEGTTTSLVSGDDGYIRLDGLSAGTYILEETKAPEGYNKLENPIKVVVTKGEEGKPVIHVDDDTTSVEKVEVKNNTGSILPSTGGMGTTLIYLIGGALVLGSGFVLANKKRAKAK